MAILLAIEQPNGSVVECLTSDPGVAEALHCVIEQDNLSFAKYWFNQPRKTHPDMTEKV